MSARPLQKLPTIRLKLGSTIVLAVGLTLALVYVFLGFALQNASRDADYVRLVRVANRAASSASSSIPPGIIVLLYRDGAFVSGTPPISLPLFSDASVHIGTTAGYEYAAVPAPAAGEGAVAYALKRSPGGFFGTVRFLRDFWWQLLVAGVIAAAIALFVARWLARGMTQPLRDMALAARRMETGDYAQRVDTASRDEVGQLATAFNRMSAELQQVEQLRRDLVANVSRAEDADLRAPRAPGEPARRRGATRPRDAAGDARAVRTARSLGRAAARSLAHRVR